MYNNEKKLLRINVICTRIVVVNNNNLMGKVHVPIEIILYN